MTKAEKRRRVMQRSMRLGHCICNPKLACPCPELREHDVCACAGERIEAPPGPLRLTRLVERPGCSSKIDQTALKRILRGLPASEDPRVLVGVPAGDDAGVYLLEEGRALVHTVDVFSPCVNDPYVFGQIAAANSVSDIYAMGGRPLTALSIIGFPVRRLPDEVMQQILRGGLDKMAEAGVSVIGGHSINDPEIKAGFAVTGVIDPKRIFTNAGARPGDVLVLTKPIGTGILAFAAQIERASPASVQAAQRCMAALNRLAAERMAELGAHACTDVTGFGLVGHLSEMARASEVDVELVWDAIPLLPGVLEAAAEGILPGGIERNLEWAGECVVLGEGATPAMLEICCDAQTSGGLLIAIAEADAARLVRKLRAEGIPEAAIVGRVRSRGSGRIELRTDGTRPIPAGVGSGGAHGPAKTELEEMDEHSSSCCGGDEAGRPAPAAEGGPTEIEQRFQEFLRAAGAPGALDAHAKQAIAIALSVLTRCAPCTRHHLKKARDMGFSEAEIDEAAWMAISFGGSPVMMFYNEARKG